MKKELLRQLIHISGVFVVLLSYIFTWNVLIALCIAIIVFLLIINRVDRYYNLPFFSFILRKCRRSEDEKGFIFFFIGIIITLIIFQFNQAIANAAILILLFGDAASTLIGRKWGKVKWPFQKNKTLEGSLAFILVGTILALTQINIIPALIGATAGAFVEVYSPIDDNIPIPIVAGLCISLTIYAGI
jgi:dolichol kinase